MHLCRENFIEADNSILSEIDLHLLKCMNDDLSCKYYDFLHGALGYGYYFLYHKYSPNRNEVLYNLVANLNEIAVVEDTCVKWCDFLYERNEHKQRRNMRIVDKNKFNLGLSHGIPSITAFLAKLLKENIHADLTRFLLEGSINFLLNAQIKNPKISLYPYGISKTDVTQNNSAPRLGWCYGDQGIATTLYLAGKSLCSSELIREANRIMEFATKRKDLQVNSINDCGLCHGSSGVAHMFTRFYWETQNSLYKAASDYWIEQSLKMAIHKDGVAGYKRWSGKDQGYIIDYGLLEGVAGIGLALLSSMSAEPLPWDELLLIS
jgi:lantibiotic biosynthesis protein